MAILISYDNTYPNLSRYDSYLIYNCQLIVLKYRLIYGIIRFVE